ncbi:MAG: hypothetical protein AAF799_23685 [Myxococcota bacterium]
MKSVGLRSALARPFRTQGRLDRGVLLAFLAINAVVLVNAVVHHPTVGYDAGKHLVHVDVLSELRLATRKDTDAFYYPPLPYVLPAAFKMLTGASLHAAAKFGQGINVLLSLGLTFFLVSACRLIRPTSALRLGTLLTLGLVPAYYRTFAYVRGEPYVAFFGTLALYLVVRVFVRGRLTTGGALGLGLSLGLAALSRQWGLFLIPAAGLFGLVHLVLFKGRRAAVVRTMLLALVVATVVGTSFLLLQRARFGSATKKGAAPTGGPQAPTEDLKRAEKPPSNHHHHARPAGRGLGGYPSTAGPVSRSGPIPSRTPPSRPPFETRDPASKKEHQPDTSTIHQSTSATTAPPSP